MKDNDINLLDCTLRDGGYVNDWSWGVNRARYIVKKLILAKIDVIEVGFLKNIGEYIQNRTISNRIEDLNNLIPKETNSNTVFAAMVMVSDYDVSQLIPYSGQGIELIRITAHEYDIDELFSVAEKIIYLGYKVSINPINIMGYSDENILNIINRVNQISPYQFSIVDTFGSMRRDNMRHLVRLADEHLKSGIRLGLHLHENMALSYSMAQDFIEMNLHRDITIDGSLMGIGRNPGNLPIELICDYINNERVEKYELDYLLDGIYDYILPIRGSVLWGYTPEYYLSAKYNLHRNYAEFYLKKGDLTTRDINLLLSRITKEKAAVFDDKYANEIYEKYQYNHIDDTEAYERLTKIFADTEVLIICPGATTNTYEKRIIDYITDNKPITIALNYEPSNFKTDYVFFSNRKRYDVAQHTKTEIVTSNIFDCDKTYYINYNSLTGAFDQGCNSLIMLLKLLKSIGSDSIKIVGADGYIRGNNYFDESLRNYEEHGGEFNMQVTRAIERLDVHPVFLTPTEYSDSVWK